MSETGKTIALIKALAGKPSDAQVESAVEGYLEEHPVGMGAFADDYSSSSTYAVGDHVIYNGSYYVCNTAITTAEEWTAAHWTITTVGEEIEDLDGRKAEINGYYEGMTVGDAEQLVATVGVTDKIPYNFRTAGGSADIGDREVDTLVGGTVAWNQLVDYNGLRSKSDNNVTIVDNNDGSYTVSTTAQGASDNDYLSNGTINVISGHKYLLVGCPSGGSGSTYRAYLVNNVESKSDFGNGAIYNATETGICYVIGMYIYKDAVITSAIKFKPQVFDLTQMFGSTIADYIYNLEAGAEGAGVAWFKKLFPKPYYAYDAGTLMSVSAASHKMTGFNQFNKSGTLNSGYLDEANSPTVHLSYKYTDYIHVVPGVSYYFKGTGGYTPAICWYDADKSFISGSKNSDATYRLISSPANAHYVRASFPAENLDTFCINLHWDGERDGDYEPYELRSYALGNVELRGIPKLDADNKLYYDGDSYESDGTVARRYGIVDLGTLTWFTSSPYKTASIAGTKKTSSNTEVANIITEKYHTVCRNATNNTGDIAIDSNGTVFVRADTDPTGMCVYELDTPTAESADPYQNPQIVNDWGTEEYVDRLATAATSSRDVSIPVGHETQYQANLRAKLEMAPNSPDGDGDYIVRQVSGENTYVQITFPADELPAAPTTDGTYVLKCTVSSGTATYSWVEET